MPVAAVVEELKKLAPEELHSLNATTIWRHATGRVNPGPRMQELYLQLTGAAVTPNDWFALATNPDLGRKQEAA